VKTQSTQPSPEQQLATFVTTLREMIGRIDVIADPALDSRELGALLTIS
jgi:hypothetical protein